jgi:protein ImuB
VNGRIACLYLPSFPLQVQVRAQPHLAGRAVAIAEPSSRHAIVCASRAARDEGVRAGMTPLQARALIPDLEIAIGDLEADHRAACALAEALLSLSTTVDVGAAPRALVAHRSVYVRVPLATRRRHLRGARFGEELLHQASRLGYRARVGIADDLFTAWAAAAYGARRSEKPFAQTCTVVPRGGAAAFLAPLSIALLPAEGDVIAMLRALGLRTLGDFAALPPPTVGRRFSGAGVDLQALARGDGPTLLTPFLPAEPIREELSVDHEVTTIEPLAFVLRPLADRACERLRGRGAAAAHIRLVLGGPGKACTTIELSPSRPITSGRAIAELARAHLSERTLDHPVTSIALEIADEAEPEIEMLDLFDRRDLSPEAIDAAIARLRAVFGEEAACSAELIDTHRPEDAYRLVPFTPPPCERAPRRPRRGRPEGGKRGSPPLPVALSETAGALRLVEPPAPQPSDLRSVDIDGRSRRVIATRGPSRIAGGWWSDAAIDRDYYEVETDDGGRYWIFRDRKAGRYYLHGIFD